MAEVLLLDRHVLASPATAYDTAWTTYGVTPGARSRAGRLEEEVPWGTHVTRVADPARLSGPVGEVLAPSNLDRLGQAVLPVEGWVGFSLWGAFGSGGPGGREGERRVLTHTVLLTPAAFRRIGGHPAGLLREDGGPAPWLRELAESSEFSEPVGLEPIRVTVGPRPGDSPGRTRLDELVRLRELVLETSSAGDPDRLRRTLSALYEALARTRDGDGLHHVVVRGVGASPSALLRLTWLSLPLEDRVEVSFVTEQRRTERPRARLLGLPGTEWGRYVPDGSWVLGENEPFEAAPGRELWAERVAAPGFPRGFEELDVRARARGWRLVGTEELDAEAGLVRWRSRWRDGGLSLDGVRELVRLERARPSGPRPAGVGAALGRAARDGGAPIDDALEVVAELPAGWAIPVVRGAVRELRRGGTADRVAAGLLRCRSVASGRVPAGELRRLVEREADGLRALLLEPSGRGGAEVVLASVVAAAAGDPLGPELVAVATEETPWTDEGARLLAGAFAGAEPEDGEAGAVLLRSLAAARGPVEAPDVWKELVSSAPRSRLARRAVLELLLDALDAGREPFGAPRAGGRSEVARLLAGRLVEGATRTGLGAERAEAVLRLLWTAGSDRVLDDLRGDPAVEVAVLVELLARPAPVPLFHRIRGRLEEALDAAPAPPSGGAPRGVDASLLAPYAPALAARLRPRSRDRSVLVARGR